MLEGSVRKSGNKLRITAQLIRTADSTHLWSETYDRTSKTSSPFRTKSPTRSLQALQIKLPVEPRAAEKGGPRTLRPISSTFRPRTAN